MLKLKNINKCYVSHKKIRVDALTDINLLFETKGIVFVLGASGSGKSTLLNIIGGLDVPTLGEVSINDELLQGKNTSLDFHRSNYISFIFQDFNLLPNLTVYENINLIHGHDSQEEQQKEIIKVLTQVNLHGYGERYPSELSGGEIQRIAIARALVKDSPIILADEPTGNLNKENGENICSILKSISQNKLVIVVSHNEELANKYADRIIRLENGKVIKDTTINEIIDGDKIFSKKNQRFSKKNIFKLCFKNLFDKKIRFSISLLSIVLCFSILALTLAIARYDRPYVDFKNITNNEVDKYLITSNSDQNRWIYNSVTNDIINYQGIEYIRNGVIKSVNDVINMGYKLYPNFREITDESIIIADELLYRYAEMGKVYYISSDEEVKKNEFHFDSVSDYYFVESQKYYISAVYETFRYTNNAIFVNQPKLESFDKSYRNFSETIVFRTPNSIYYRNGHSFNIGSYEWQFTVKAHLQNGNKSIIDVNAISAHHTLHGKAYFNTETYFEEKLIEQLKQNEIYVSLDIYNSVFNEKSSAEYYLGNDYFNRNVVRQPPSCWQTN